MDEVISSILAADAVPYEPRVGDRSLLAGFPGYPRRPTRAEALAQPIRAFTIDWLAWELSIAGRIEWTVARNAIVEGIPVGDEHILDGGLDQGFEYLCAFDTAAFTLGIDPFTIPLRPEHLHS